MKIYYRLVLKIKQGTGTKGLKENPTVKQKTAKTQTKAHKKNPRTIQSQLHETSKLTLYNGNQFLLNNWYHIDDESILRQNDDCTNPKTELDF